MTVQETGAPPSTPPRRVSRWLGPVRVTGAVLGVGLIGLGTLSVMAQFATREATQTFTVTDAVDTLKVDVGAGDVTVHHAAFGTPLRVEATTRSAIRKASWSKSVDAGTLTLTGACSGGWPIDNCSVSYDISLPADIGVDLHTGSGDQSVTGLNAAIKLRARSGDIRMAFLLGDVDARTGSGDITGASLGIENYRLRTGSGDIKAVFSDEIGTLTAQTGSGDIRVGFLAPPTTVTAKTGSGDVRVSVPHDGTRYDVTGTTGSGDRHIEVPTSSGGNRIAADTGSGDVTINFP
jgi:hypothetical protein